MGYRRFVDLSISIEPDLPSDPPIMIPKIDYIDHAQGAGMDRESTLYLLEKEVKVVEIDAWSWDRPLPFLAKEFKETGDSKVIWEAHFAGIEMAYCPMEKMANLSKIGRPHGFTICCFPVKIKGASAAWTRPVAIVDEA
ncbi:MAG: hypothetical protein JRJ29_18240 [Deltaproteobacteria bacterium]|nr:hypothetical protein [Deltaproteobacteria bacterium]